METLEKESKANKAETQILRELLQAETPKRDTEVNQTKGNNSMCKPFQPETKGNKSMFKPFQPEAKEPDMVQENPQWQDNGGLFTEIMQEVVLTTTPEPNWNTQIPQGQSEMEENLDLDQLATIQVTTDLASIRRHLQKKLSTWATIMLILGSSVVQIDAAKSPNVTEAAMLKEREIFKPVNLNTGPLFATTAEPSLTEVSSGNITLTLETFHKNPYMKTSIETQSQSYAINTQVVDISNLAISSHNALKFLNSHNQHQTYKKQLGFKSKPPSQDVLFTGEETMYKRSQFEYAKYPEKVGYSDCGLVCPIMDASLPASPQQLNEAAEIYNLTQKDRMWIKTTQNATKRSSWSWEHIYDYEISWNGEQIYPNEGQEGVFLPFRMKTQCQAFKNEKPVDHEQIGYIYQYYADDGSYHRTEPYRLEIAVNPNWECTVSVPNSDISYSHYQDDNTCICVRLKSNHIHETNKIEASNILHSLSKLANDTPIETWRIKTTSPTSDLEEVNNKIIPRYTREDREKANMIKQGYLSEADLTTLRLRAPRSRALKKRDIFSGLLKILMSNPSLLTNLHQKVQDQSYKEPHSQTIPTQRVIGSDQTFTDNINGIFPRFKIQKKGNIITVSDKHKNQPDWKELDKSTTDLQAAEGIRQARRSNVNLKVLKERMIPNMLSNMVIPRSDLAKTEVAMNAETITQATYYGTYITIKTFVPIILPKTTRIYKVAALPYDHDSVTGKYITKDLEERIVMTPGSNDKPFNITSRCQQEVMKDTGRLQHCQNKEVSYEEISKLMTIKGDWSLYLIKDIGEITISCPRSKLLWFNLLKHINIFIIKNTCLLKGPGELHIPPSIEEASHIDSKDDISVICLLSYNLHQDWIPSTFNRWITQIVTVSVMAVISCTLIVCIVFLCWKKPWYCRVITRQPDKQQKLAQVLRKKLETVENKIKNNSRDSGLEQEHFEEMHFPMNRISQEDGELLSFRRDYDRDLMNYNGSRQDQVEQWYATVKRKPKDLKKSPTSEPVETVFDPKTDYETDDETDNKARNSAVHWKFDNKPLVARSNKN